MAFGKKDSVMKLRARESDAKPRVLAVTVWPNTVDLHGNTVDLADVHFGSRTVCWLEVCRTTRTPTAGVIVVAAMPPKNWKPRYRFRKNDRGISTSSFPSGIRL